MKKFSIILNVVLVLVVLFLILYAQIQTNLANENHTIAMTNLQELNKQTKLAEHAAEIAQEEAARAREAEAKALETQVQLEICQSSK
jgi:outer membrane protein assembly factor BamD (BamD/ComL family)